MKSATIVFLILALFTFGCNTGDSAGNESTTESTPDEPEVTGELEEDVSTANDESGYAPMAVDDEAAEWITGLLVDNYLKEDMEYLEARDRKFQFFKVDLNEDGEEEYFIRFMSPWFCGTGGCSFYLLSHEGEMITSFTVMSEPVWVEPTKKNGWKILLVRDRGVLRELVYENGTYPPNPTVVDEAPYDAASGEALVMFDEQFGKAKTYTF